MIFRLLGLFMAGVMFDGFITILRFQAPGVLEPLIRFWKDLAMLGLLGLYAICAIRAGGVRVAVPRALIATWMLLVGLGFIDFIVCRAQGNADPEQAVRALRMHYQYPLLFALFALPVRRLPTRFEENLFHGLGAIAPFIVAIGCSQAFFTEAWTNAGWVNAAVQAKSIDLRNFEGLFRPFGTFTSAFSFGHCCALITVYAVAHLLFHRRANGFYWLLLPVSLAGLWISTIRASILGTLAAVTYLAFVRLKMIQGIGIRIMIGSSLVAVCIATPFVLAARNEKAASQAVGYVNKSSLAERIDDEWKPAWARLKTPADFAFGLGTGAIGGSIRDDRLGSFRYNAVDNYYLLVGVNHGILGMIVWAAFVFQLGWLIMRASMVETEITWFLHGTVALLVLGLGASFFRMLLAAPPEAVTSWVLLGVAAARAYEIIQQRKPSWCRTTEPPATLPAGARA